MILSPRLAVAPVLALVAAGLTAGAAHATVDPLSTEAVDALAVASCQLDPLTPLTLEEMAPVVVGEADVDVVPGEITAHLVRAQVSTSAGDVQQCTFGVLHRDAQLKQVQHLGTVSLALVDTAGGETYGADTDIELGNMGKSSPVDPTTEVVLAGFLSPLAAIDDPTYAISVDRKSLEVVQIATTRAAKNAAARLLAAQSRAAAKLLKKQTKAAKGKHSDKMLAAAQRNYDRAIAKAQARYDRAVAPKTVTRPVIENVTVGGSILAG